MSDVFYIYPGAWVSAAQVTSSYSIPSLPVQSGQGGYRWIRPLNDADVVNQGAEVRKGLHGGAAFVGAKNGVLPIHAATPDQAAYIRSYLMGNAASAKATYKLFNRFNNTTETYWVWLIDKLSSSHYGAEGRAAGGTRRYELEWVAVQAAPGGPGLALTVTVDEAAPDTIGQTLTWTIEVENDGDYTTLGDIVVTSTMPSSGWDLTTVTASGWTVTYSTNNGTSYSGTPPSPLNNTTNVKCTRTATLAIDGTASFTIAGDITNSDTYTLSASATTEGVTQQTDSDSATFAE